MNNALLQHITVMALMTVEMAVMSLAAVSMQCVLVPILWAHMLPNDYIS